MCAHHVGCLNLVLTVGSDHKGAGMLTGKGGQAGPEALGPGARSQESLQGPRSLYMGHRNHSWAELYSLRCSRP